MLVVAAGCVAFVLLSLADELSLRGRRALKGAAFGSSVLLSLAALVAAILGPVRWMVPAALRAAGWILTGLSAALAFLSLLVEVRTPTAYLGARAAPGLVTTGTYAMCRHPGVLWFTLLMGGLVLVTGSRLLALAAPFWIGLDIAHVAWQERRYLVPVYGARYRSYQTAAPMLIPTISSIRRGLATLHTGRRADGNDA